VKKQGVKLKYKTKKEIIFVPKHFSSTLTHSNNEIIISNNITEEKWKYYT